jgi:superoxide dismutase, Cu-Zn family
MHATPPRLTTAMLLLGLTGCATLGGAVPTADVALVARSGSAVTGTLTFTEGSAGVRLRGEIRGLKAGAEHGFHIHEKGDCSAPDATSAGGHFNPGGTAHGRHGAGEHHAGDLPSLVADADGVARVDAVIEGITLLPGTTSATGRSVIVHRDPDDYVTQPTGNSGPRIACGVLVLR